MEEFAQRLTRLERAGAPRHPRLAVRGRWRRLGAVLGLVILLAVAPLGALAAGYVDLNPGSAHNGNINAITDAGITRGCTDAQHYCPDEYVTREQLASFLARTAGLGGNPPVADAKTVGGYAPNGLVRAAAGTGTIGNGAVVLEVAHNIPMAGVTITVPGPGFVLVTGAVNIFGSSSPTPVDTMTRLRDTGPGGATSPVLWSSIGNAAGGGVYQSVSPTWLFQVSAAGTKTYVLEVHPNGNGSKPTSASNGTITALYVPFGKTGTTP
jgi:hypothetical protein